MIFSHYGLANMEELYLQRNCLYSGIAASNYILYSCYILYSIFYIVYILAVTEEWFSSVTFAYILAAAEEQLSSVSFVYILASLRGQQPLSIFWLLRRSSCLP